MPILQPESLIKQLWAPWAELKAPGGIPIFGAFILSIAALLFVHFFYNLITRDDRNRPNFPPSPPKLPVIGNLHQIMGKQPPYRSLHALSQKYGPLMLLHMGQAPTLVVSSAEILEELVKSHDIALSNRFNSTIAKILFYGCSDFALAPYGEYWRRLRRICVSELLSNTRVQSFRFAREEEVALLVDKIRNAASSGKSVNLTEALVATLHALTSRCIIGKKAKERDEKFGELSKQFILVLTSNFAFGDFFPYLGWLDVLSGLVGRLKAMFNQMDAFLQSFIEEQTTLENDMAPNIVQILLQLQKEGMLDKGVTQDNLKAILLDMFAGGVENPATTIQMAMAELMKYPEILKKVQEEVRRVVGSKGKVDEDDISQMEYMKCVIKETLRLSPSAPTISPPREISARIKLRGYDILPKTRVFVNVWAIQRDPKSWDKPEDFLPERFLNNPIDYRGQDFEFTPFGVGRRICPGISFAVVAVEYILANLLYWFDWKLPSCSANYGGDLDLSDSHGGNNPLNLGPVVYCS